MAAEFIGLQMLVTLQGDPPRRLKGTVSAVEAGAGLTLSNVWMLDTNEWKPRVTIASAEIADVSEVPAATAQSVAQLPPQAVFFDPAIVAVGKPAVPPSSGHVPDPNTLPNTSEKSDPEPAVNPSAQVTSPSREATPTTVVSASLKGLKVGGSAATVESGEEKDSAEIPLDYGELTGEKKKSQKMAGRGKGWRQTPILQSTASFQPFSSLKRNAKGRKALDGWASEDVTDVQEMGDFDFEGGLAKFDKKHLFEQIRKDDLTDEADRLVSHNRLPRPKPGTAGGKNLHYSENVLDMPPTILKPPKDRPTASKETPNDFWNSEADDGVAKSGERLSGRERGVGSRQGSRRGESKVSAGRRSQSRKASEQARAGPGPSRVSSGLPTAAAAPQGLYVLPSNRRIEPVSALQMLNLENIAHNEIGLTEEMMTENAGRGIAEVTLTALSDPAIKVRHAGNVDPATGSPPSPPQTVVVLAGNNKSGSRAMAAARHLRNKDINVLVCVVGLERGERDLLEDVQRQVRLYRNLGGRAFTKSDLFEHLRKISIPKLTIDTPRTSLGSLANPAPVMLIVDALLGLAISFEELRNGDQATVYELIEWANRNEAFVLAVDVPSGIDPTSGRVSVIDGSRLYVKPRYVVAVGAPKRGLLEAMIAAENDDNDNETVLAGEAPLLDDAEWKLHLVDMGLGQAVWKKAGTKMRKGVDFGEKWVLEMRYRGTLTSEEGDDEELL